MTKENYGEKYCIIRTRSAGVFAGFIDLNKEGQENIVYNARRIWYWDGASSLSELAAKGTSKPQNCKFPCEVEEIHLKEIIEIIPCTKEARDSIAKVKIWSSHA